MSRPIVVASLALLVACSGDDSKDSAAVSDCANFAEAFAQCTVDAGLEPDPSLADTELYCEENTDETEEQWTCLYETVETYSFYCTGADGLTNLQAELAACRGF